MKHLLSILFCFLTMLFMYGCSIDDGGIPYKVTGKISQSDGSPIEGVKVELKLAESSLETFSDAEGRYVLKEVTSGFGIISFSKGDFTPQSMIMEIHGKRKISNNIILKSLKEDFYLAISAREETVEYLPSIIRLSITSNGRFTISCNAEWLSTPVESLEGNKTIILTIQENDSPEQRSAEVTFRGEYGLEQRFTVTQKGTPAL